MSINEANIDVSVSETTITLSGTVSSLYQKEEASRIAWKSIGVSNVKNELVINNESIFN